MSERALVIVDAQRGFMPAAEGERLGVPGFGDLPVTDGEKIVPLVNKLAAECALAGARVVYTRDYHPPVTAHFSEDPNWVNTWPRHCVAGTPGALLHPDILLPVSALGFVKGTEPLTDGEDDMSYTGYFAVHPDTGMSLPEYLDHSSVKEVDVVGLATDYCVRATALDLRNRMGLRVNLVTDAVRGVAPETTARALDDMAEVGIRMVTTEQVLAELALR